MTPKCILRDLDTLDLAQSCSAKTNLVSLPAVLTYGMGPMGSIQLRSALSKYLTRILRPYEPIDPSTVVITSGASGALDILGFTFCDDREGIIIGRPLYNGFNVDLCRRAK